MSQEISKGLKCIVLKNGVEIWKESERVDSLSKELLNQNGHRFFRVDGELINTAEIVGVFTPETMDALIRRKNGQWNCSQGKWHDRNTRCECSREDWFDRESKKTDQMLRQINPNAPQA